MLLYRGIGNVGFYLIFIAASCQLTLVIAALIQMYQGRKTSTPTARKTYSVVETLERNSPRLFQHSLSILHGFSVTLLW